MAYGQEKSDPMDEIILKALERSESPKKARNAGFIPGVIGVENGNSISVKFDASELKKIIAKHGKNAKLWVESGAGKKFGVIMEIQKNPIDGKIIHVSIKEMTADHSVKIELPIIFHGRDDLLHRRIQLHVHKSQAEAEGDASLMPDSIIIDVSMKNLDDTITAQEFHLPPEIKILEPANEIYAVIKAIREELVEEPVAKPVEGKPAEIKPGETRPVAMLPGESKPGAAKPAPTKPDAK